ncbi:IS200/IS605 family transposase [Candidatus Babeliales bacterium]|nr:IS200/IS605 family transposase [Candidatus Babeliales bacterium]
MSNPISKLRNKNMGHAYASQFSHLVWSTKNRQPLIDKSFRNELYRYIRGIIDNKQTVLLNVGGTNDHIHVLVSMPPKNSTSDLVRAIKSNSSRFIRSMDNPLSKKFAWQEGYAVFSVSKSVVESVSWYIKQQETHHKKYSFEDEFIGLLKKHGIAYDKKDLFE